MHQSYKKPLNRKNCSFGVGEYLESNFSQSDSSGLVQFSKQEKYQFGAV